MRHLLIVGFESPAVVRFTDDEKGRRALLCLVCGENFEGRGYVPGVDLDDMPTEDIIALAENHADRPHGDPYPQMVERPPDSPDGSMFGYDLAGMIDRYGYEPAGDITDEHVTTIAPILAALLCGEVKPWTPTPQ